MTEKNRSKNPVIALILSALLPGLGQLYIRKFTKGFFLIGFNVVINILIREPLLVVLDKSTEVDDPTLIVFAGYLSAGLVLWIYAMIDAKKGAEKLNVSTDEN